MTPEGRVKVRIRAVLDRYGARVYTYMSVPNGFGGSTLDYLGACCGLAFAIEAKRRGRKPTPRQETIIERLEAAGVKVFVIDDDDDLLELDQWLTTVVTAKASLSL